MVLLLKSEMLTWGESWKPRHCSAGKNTAFTG